MSFSAYRRERLLTRLFFTFDIERDNFEISDLFKAEGQTRDILNDNFLINLLFPITNFQPDQYDNRIFRGSLFIEKLASFLLSSKIRVNVQTNTISSVNSLNYFKKSQNLCNDDADINHVLDLLLFISVFLLIILA